jgi:hypothetical protein
MSRQFVHLGTVGAADWKERPVAIVGGGPSLRGFNFERIRERFTIVAVNASIFDIPFASAGFTIDRRAARNWWPRLVSEVKFPLYFAVPDPWLVNFTCPPTPQMMFLRRTTGSTFTHHRGVISGGGTSGFGALHLAFLKGARKVTLFGFDYSPSPQGEWHHNQKHYAFKHAQVPANWSQWARNFDNVAPVLREAGVEVVNASPRSAITAFPRVSLNEALA